MFNIKLKKILEIMKNLKLYNKKLEILLKNKKFKKF